LFIANISSKVDFSEVLEALKFSSECSGLLVEILSINTSKNVPKRS